MIQESALNPPPPLSPKKRKKSISSLSTSFDIWRERESLFLRWGYDIFMVYLLLIVLFHHLCGCLIFQGQYWLSPRDSTISLGPCLMKQRLLDWIFPSPFPWGPKTHISGQKYWLFNITNNCNLHWHKEKNMCFIDLIAELVCLQICCRKFCNCFFPRSFCFSFSFSYSCYLFSYKLVSSLMKILLFILSPSCEMCQFAEHWVPMWQRLYLNIPINYLPLKNVCI